jgi:hypothetical protein
MCEFAPSRFQNECLNQTLFTFNFLPASKIVRDGRLKITDERDWLQKELAFTLNLDDY